MKPNNNIKKKNVHFVGSQIANSKKWQQQARDNDEQNKIKVIKFVFIH